MTPIIEVKNISKKYNISHQQGSYVALRDVLANIFYHPLRFAKKKVTAPFKAKEEFWALKDVNFTVQKGETLGIIGANGAGKSTLLKILTQITPPTTGEIKLVGTVASMLEVGTGFHPELTGRENVFLNGATLGMRRSEIAQKFDDIVEFSGVEKFIDTPIKYYSSGMQIRLAFAVAAHLEPDILIIDEVLAVGDAEFQKKCLAKMKDITQKEGRTILFVSHNLLLIQNLCKKTILLEHGELKKIGATEEVINTYIHNRSNRKPESSNAVSLPNENNTGNIRFTGIKISNTEDSGVIKSDAGLKIVLTYSSDYEKPITDARIVINIVSESSQQIVLRLDSDVTSESFPADLQSQGEIVCETESINLAEGKYFADINFVIQGTSRNLVKMACEFEVGTDLTAYKYKTYPDKSVCDHVIKYSFKQNG